MLTDAHCHPFDLAEYFPAAEDERRWLGVMCASSAATLEEFEYCEKLSLRAKENSAAPMLPCFAVHPQTAAVNGETQVYKQLAVLDSLAEQGRLAAVGETGFDLYNAAFRETEKIQDELFAVHLDVALRYDLPVVIHVRRAMHKIFAFTRSLKKCRAVIFHSWPGTAGEGDALIRRGINAFFSFGATIVLNRKETVRCCAVFPARRLLTETDAPFQPLRQPPGTKNEETGTGKNFSRYSDLGRILEAAAALRREAGTEVSGVEELEKVIEGNFRAAFTTAPAPIKTGI